MERTTHFYSSIMLHPRIFLWLLFFFLVSCGSADQEFWQEEIIESLGSKYRTSFQQNIEDFNARIRKDSQDVPAYLGIAESNIYLFIFGYVSRDRTVPEARMAFRHAYQIDSLSSEVHRMSGILSFLDWDWNSAPKAFIRAIETDPQNLSARHWYSLYLAAMGRFAEAMAQSDTIMTMDPNEDFLIGRGSLLYFQHQFEELKDLMLRTIPRDSTLPWGYDWLGMAYNGIEEHQASIDTYVKAFELSDGTVEVGAGLGHALGLGGRTHAAEAMAGYYTSRAQSDYLPPVQRSFIHLGIGEYDQALALLEQAFKEKSWFLIFIQIEPWYDPIRDQPRFQAILDKMNFPEGTGIAK
ncbi:MAG: hypothetical protein HKN76_16415 [Saprospiraceae bacterium]|nr:hypothetical protein [Saprospiraceae bacterium]